MDQLVNRLPGKASHEAEERGAYSEFLIACRADITQYAIWHKSHTEPLLIDAQRTGKSDSLIERAWRVVAGIAATANQYVMLEPNVMGLGLRVNRIIDDITKRSKMNRRS